MEDEKKTLAAIDIGTTKIAILVAEKTSNGKYEVLSFASNPSRGISRGVVVGIDDTVRSIEYALESLKQNYDKPIDEVYVGIAGQYVSTLRNRCSITVDGIVEEKHIIELKNIAKNNMGNPGAETLDAILLSYYINGECVSDPIGREVDVLQGNFQIISGQSTMVGNIKKCVTLCNLKTKSLFLEPLASAKAVLTPEEKDNGVVMVDIGGGTTDVAIFQKGKIVHTAVIPIAGNAITNDIKTHFGISTEQAELAKVNYGSASKTSSADVTIEVEGTERRYITRQEMAEVIQARVEEILNAVKFQIEVIFPDVPPKSVVITGGGSLIANLKQFANFILKTDIRIATPSMAVVGEYVEALNKPQYSTVVGLIACGFEYEETKHNEFLIKQRELDEIRRREEEVRAREEAEAERQRQAEAEAAAEATRAALEESKRKEEEQRAAQLAAEEEARRREEEERRRKKEESKKNGLKDFCNKFLEKLSEE